MTPDEALTLAISWAERGVPAMPMQVSWDTRKSKTNKKPLTTHGHKSATTDPAALHSMFRDARVQAGDLAVGLWPGPAGYLVVDDDGGLDDNGEITNGSVELVHTYHVVSASGGLHLWFRKKDTTVQIGNESPWDGIDIRADNGGIMAPGSRVVLRTPQGEQTLEWWETMEFEGNVATASPSLWDALTHPVATRRMPPPASSAANQLTAHTRPSTAVTGRYRALDRHALHPLDRRTLELAEAAGGHDPYLSADGSINIVRPEKAAGTSATIGYIGPGIMKFWTPNWAMDGDGSEFFSTDCLYVPEGDRLVPDLDTDASDTITAAQDSLSSSRWRTGGAFIFDQPATVATVWGNGEEVLWASGESLILCGPPGVGKSTIAAQLVSGLLGLTTILLGLPITPTDGKVLYLAMDRPAQLRRLLARLFTDPANRAVLDERLVIWTGPPPRPFTDAPEDLLRLCREAGATAVVVDSIKDAATELSDSGAGTAINRAFQLVLEEGIDVLALHHLRKASSNRAPASLSEIYGSAMITAGAGSVVSFHGSPGAAVVGLRHLKQPMAEVGPCKIQHDQVTGRTTLFGRFDMFQYLDAHGSAGATVADAVQTMFNTPNPDGSQVAKARRQLNSALRI